MVTIVNNLSLEMWQEYVAQHPQSNIFHTPEMFQVFAQTPGYQPQLWAALDVQGNICVLFLPVLVTLFDGLLRRWTTRAILYGGALSTPDPQGQAALQALLAAYQHTMRNEALITEVRHTENPTALPILDAQGFVHTSHLNYLIALDQPVEAVMAQIGSRTRKNIRRALRSESISVTMITEREQLRAFYTLLEQTYAAAHVPLAPFALFEAAFDVLASKDMAKFFLVTVDGHAAASSVELLFKDKIYGWYGGLSREYSRHSPNELLMWHILQWGATHGYRVYDFGGAGEPDAEYGVRDFKAKFGGKLVNFGRDTWVHTSWRWQLTQWAYKVYQTWF